MCGIAGHYRYSPTPKNEISRSRFKNIMSTIQHRGPDQYGDFFDSQIALGTHRLAIQDVKHGSQPIASDDRLLTIVLNGEIYNHLELRKTYLSGQAFRSRSDAETALYLYRELGPSCVERLNGMFAFSIWDSADQKLFCARDHSGQKPFFFCSMNGVFMFASEVSAIHMALPDTRVVSQQSIALYLAQQTLPPDRTMFCEIDQLPPGSVLTVSKKGVNAVHRYWRYPLNDEPDKPADNAALQQNIRDTFSQSVGRCLIGDAPIGAFLSGGIDTTAVVATAAKTFDTRLPTFSAYFSESSFDESPYIEYVRRLFGLRHCPVRISDYDALSTIGALTSRLDSPIGDPSIIPRYIVARRASAEVKVLLGGDGSDELLGGYPTFMAQRLLGMLQLLPEPALRKTLLLIRKLTSVSSRKFNAAYLLDRILEMLPYAPEVQVHLWHGSLSINQVKTVIDPKVSVDWENLYSNLAAIGSQEKRASVFEWMFLYYFHVYLVGDLEKVDRCSMLNAVEVRAPFLDKDFIELVAPLDARAKYRRITSKYVFKKAMKGTIPEYILNRPKGGFTVPISIWLKNGLKDWAGDTLGPSVTKRLGVLDASIVEQRLQTHLAGSQDLGREIWILAMLQGWLTEHRYSIASDKI